MKLFSNILFAKIYPESDKVPFRVRGTGYVRNDPATRQKMRVCNFVELFWCVGGGCTFHYPEGTYTLHPGEVAFTIPGCLHDYIRSTPVLNIIGFPLKEHRRRNSFRGSIHPGFRACGNMS